MLPLLLIVYSIAILVTWFYSGFASGRELSEVKDKMDKAGAPPQYIQINYVNVFFQGLCWPVYWAVFVGMWAYKRSAGAQPVTQGEPVKTAYRKPERYG